MQQDPNRGSGPDEGWSERRNGDDPFYAEGQWTQVTSRGAQESAPGQRSAPAGMPPAYSGNVSLPPQPAEEGWGKGSFRGKSGGGLFRHRDTKGLSPDRPPEPPGNRGPSAPPQPMDRGQPYGGAAWPGDARQQTYPPQPTYAPQPGPYGTYPTPQAEQRGGANAPQPFPGQPAPRQEGGTASGEPPAEEEKKDEAVQSRTVHIRVPSETSIARSMPATGIPRRDRSVSRSVYVLIALVAILAAGAAVFMMLRSSSQEYAYVTRSTLSTSYAGDALVVRNETVYTQEGVSRVEYIAEEGADVQRAENVCVVYSSGFSDKELTTLANYRRQIKDYHKTLLAGTTTKDVQLDRLENNVLNLAGEIQNMIQENRGSLVNEEAKLTEAMQARQVYLKQKYPDDQKLARLYDDENTQLQRISSWTKQYAAAAGGIVSFYTDGYENALNLNNYAGYTPTEIRALYNGNVPSSPGVTKNTVAIYRLVRQGSWVVLLLCDNREWVPVEGRTYKLLIEGFDSTVVNATVESFTRSGGELLVRLTVTGDINIGNILYMRACRVQLGESVDSLSVPSRALYTRQGRIGVVIATQSGEYWTGVEVISNDGVTAHIIPENLGVLYEGIPVLLF